MALTIETEKFGHEKDIENVTRLAFLNAPHTEHTEHFIVNALRKAKELTISLVAKMNDKIVGHVAVSGVAISDGSKNWYGLGPISVLPEYQSQGVGHALMLSAITQLKDINASGCVLLGDPGFYSKFGFKAEENLVLTGVPAEYFQTLLINGDLPKGSVEYHPAFNAKS